jgi:hypothetical protein
LIPVPFSVGRSGVDHHDGSDGFPHDCARTEGFLGELKA